MYKQDILVLVYPSLKDLKRVIILNPFDQKIMMFNVDSVEELKEVLEENLPFCSQHHDTDIHFGVAVVMDWESLPDSPIHIKKPEDIYRLLS